MLNRIKQLMTSDEYCLFKKGLWLSLLDAIFNAVIYSTLFLTLMAVISKTLSTQMVLQYSIVVLLVSVIRFFTTKKSVTMMQVNGAKGVAKLRIKVGEHIRKLNMGYYNKHNIGSLTSTLTNDLNDYEMLITHQTTSFVKLLTLSVYLMAVMLIMFPGIGYIHVAIILINVPIGLKATKAVTTAGKKAKHVRATMIAKIIEYTKGIEVFKSYHLVGASFKKLSDVLVNLKNKSIKLELAGAKYVVPMQIITNVSLPIMMYVAINHYHANQLARADLIVYLVLALAMTNIVKNTILVYIEMSYFQLGIMRVIDTLNTPEIEYQTEQFKPANANISFNSVDFSYIKDKPILRKIDFDVRAGERIAIVGPSGSGKSTILNLIARFWDPDAGAITIGDIDSKTVFPDALLSKVSMVFQDVYLINDSVMENIRVGNVDASDEAVIEAAKIAHAHEFIENLPNGYHTVLSEAGGNISGGEKQRISIARALLKDADIILLDEATASLDVDNEAKIQNSLKTLTKGKTEIVIAHRLNTIKNSDKILVVDEGQIIEFGSHDNLMAAKGRYHEMYSTLASVNQWSI